MKLQHTLQYLSIKLQKQMKNRPQEDPMQKSMQGTSQFIAFDASMQKSMCGSSQKIPIDNASTVNKLERERDLRAYKQLKGNSNNSSIKETDQGDEENEFLNVGKWNKSKHSPTAVKPTSIADKIQKMEVVGVKEQKRSQKQLPPASKWQKKKSSESGMNRSTTSHASETAKVQKQQTYERENKVQAVPVVKDPVVPKPEPKITEKEEEVIQDEVSNDDEEDLEQEDDEEEEEEDQEEEEEEEQEEEEEEQEQEQQDDEDNQNEDIQQEQQPQQQEEQAEQIEDKFTSGTGQQFQQSSEVYKTETVNTSAVNQTPVASKWGKKKAPLETMTKYEGKEPTAQQGKKGYHSRINSAAQCAKGKEDEIAEDIQPQNLEEWNKVEKVLLRLKLLLS